MVCGFFVTSLKEETIGWRIFYFITTAGICWSSQLYFYKIWSVQWLSILISVAAFPFLYVWVAATWSVIRKHVAQMNLFSEFGKKEGALYVVIFFALCALAIFAFTQSKAFYGVNLRYDIVYTSDSIDHLRDSVYTTFWQAHNSIKQPMFTLFAAPMSGAAFFAGKVLGLSAAWRALLIVFSQIALMMCSVFTLAKMLHLRSYKRVCFVLAFLSGYTSLLFTIMMEQFIVSVFWLFILLYQIAEKEQPDPFVFVASGGTLVTNLVYTPTLSSHAFTRNYKAWIKDMCGYVGYFMAAWVGSGQIVTLLNLASGVDTEISAFGGASLSLYERLSQYTAFIKNYFLMPRAGIVNLTLNDLTWEGWQLMPITDIHIAGVVILVLALLSVWVNRQKRSSLVAGIWVLFSAAALGCLGWGSVENGMILYSLYFGWPFATLLFQLLEKLEDSLRVKFVVPTVCIAFVTASLLYNIPALYEMIEVLASIYPG